MSKQLPAKKKLQLIFGHIFGLLLIVGLLSFFGPTIHVYLQGSMKSESFKYILTVVFKIILILVKIVCLLISVAYFTIAERKIMAAIQRRKGPDVVGIFGLLQPLADGLKLLLKEILIPTRANAFIFILAPIMILTLSLISWSVIPFGFSAESSLDATNHKKLMDFYLFHTASVANVRCGLLFLLAISSLNVYGIIIAGWASNSKYAFLGSLRSSAQMISYEVSIGLCILPVILLAGSLNIGEIVYIQSITGWFVFPLLPCTIIFFVSMLAETNRAPFDLPEAEAELVAGYNVEYSSIIFAMFFLGEYSNMLLMSAVITLLFFGGWLPGFIFPYFLPSAIIFSIKISFFCFLFILVRAAFPRYRYDQLMNIGWKIFLPITTGYLLFVVAFLIMTNSVIVTSGLLQS